MGTLVSLTGPSCVGKSTLERMMEGAGFNRLISFTTRKPREGEVDGVDYSFVSKEEAAQRIAAGTVLQYVEYNDHYYGTDLADLERVTKNGGRSVIVVEPNGVNNIRAALAEREVDVDYIAVFLNASTRALMDRLVLRFQSDPNFTKADFLRRYKLLTRTEILNWHAMADYDIRLPSEDPKDSFIAMKRIIELVDARSAKAA